MLVLALAACGRVDSDPVDTGPVLGDTLDPDRVARLDLVITPEDHQRMQDDLAELLGDAGGAPGGGGLPGGGGFPDVPADDACDGLQGGDPCETDLTGAPTPGICTDLMGSLVCMPEDAGVGGPPGGDPGGEPGGGVVLDFTEVDPVWVEATVILGERTWDHVGIRYKGNSSLTAGFQQGNRKLPFRLDFDKWDDVYPETADQRMDGYEKMTFGSNYSDDSQIREAYMAELFREFGVDAPTTSFVEVWVDVGDGPAYWGLYTAVEDPADDPMLDRVLGDHSGNVYKPESTWVTFDEAQFEKKRNEDEADFSDVIAAIDALHADTSDPAAWRADLEAVFDAHHFLRWLALNTVVQNWDTYGQMAHNYYLYGVPGEGGRLRWVPWDGNMSMMDMGLGFGGGPAAGDPILLDGVGADWPLISRLLADPVYQEIYRADVQEVVDTVFASERAEARIRELHALVEASALREEPGSTTLSSQAAFEGAADDLIAHVASRHALVESALASP